MTRVRAYSYNRNGKTVQVQEHEDKRAKRGDQPHGRLAIGVHKDQSHYVRAVTPEDAKRIESAAAKHGIPLERRRALARHEGKVGTFDHYHSKERHHIEKVFDEVHGEDIKHEAKKVFGDHEQAKKDYAQNPNTMGGKKIDVDEARELVHSYRENRTLGAAILHADASTFSKKAFAERLAMPIQDPDETVTFMAGGGGSGKGTASKAFQLEEASHTILDGALSDYAKAKDLIDQAVASGRKVEINFIYRPVDKATHGMVKRAHGSGRIVPLDVLAAAHRGAHETVQKLITEFGLNNKRVSIRVFDNSGESIKDVKEIPDSEVNEFLKKTAYDDTIAKRVAQAYRGVKEHGYEHEGKRHRVEERISRHLDPALQRLDAGEQEGPHREAAGHPSGDEGGNQSHGRREVDEDRPEGRSIAKAHVKGHIRRLDDGRTVWVKDHEDQRRGRAANLQERTAFGKHKDGTHYLRASDGDDAATIQKVIGRVSPIGAVKRDSQANHHGEEGKFTHFHFTFPEQAAAVYSALGQEQDAPEEVQPGLFGESTTPSGKEEVPDATPTTGNGPSGNAERPAPKEEGESPERKELRTLMGLDKAKIEAFQPEKSVYKSGRQWRYETIQGGSGGSAYETKKEAVSAAEAHLKLIADQYAQPELYRDIVSARATKWLEFEKRHRSEGLGEMDAAKKATADMDAFTASFQASAPRDDAPKDGDRNVEGLIFHDGRWHREEEPTAGPLTLEHLRDTRKRIRAGEITPEELKAEFGSFMAQKDALQAELLSMSKAKMLERLQVDPASRTAKNTQKDLAKAYVEQLRDGYNVKGSFTWSPGSEKVDDAVARQVEKTTAEDIAAYAEGLKARMEERRTEVAKIKAAIENPQTLEDFEIRARYKAPDLTQEQKVRWDELKADAHRAAKEKANPPAPVVSEGDLGMQLHATKHTKTGEDLHVVTLASRVDRDAYNSILAKAKALGGWYSSYRGNGAIPGFTFKNPESAKAFMGQTFADAHLPPPITPEERKAEQKAKVSSKLRDLAEGMIEKADSELDRDRKTHTHRMADQAARSVAQAEGQKAMGQTMLNLAAAIEDGRAKHLGGLKNRAQVEALDSVLDQAIRSHWRAQGLTYTEEQKEKGRPANMEDIEHAEYPYPSLWNHTFRYITKDADKVPGTKRSMAKLEKALGGKEHVTLAHPELIEAAADIASKIGGTPEGKRLKDLLAPYHRLQSAGIETPEQLRSALREFIVYKAMAKGEDPIKAAERSLIGAKIPGYFPTPSDLASEVIRKADIHPGMSVLEPSAGKGSLIDAIHEAHGKNLEVDAIEPVSSLRTILQAKGHKLVGRDILEHEHPEGYDRVVMNPPFENGQDIDHVRKAYELLKPGGRLVAITGAGAHQRSDKKAKEFQEWLEERGAVAEKNPEGSFKTSDRPTGVSTYTVTIDKPGNAEKAA